MQAAYLMAHVGEIPHTLELRITSNANCSSGRRPQNQWGTTITNVSDLSYHCCHSSQLSLSTMHGLGYCMQSAFKFSKL